MNTNLKSYDEFDDFEKNIIDEMMEYAINKEDAVRIFNLYLPVFQQISADYLEDECFYADQFIQAYNKNFTPEQWLKKLQRIDIMFGTDQEENQSSTIASKNTFLQVNKTMHM